MIYRFFIFVIALSYSLFSVAETSYVVQRGDTLSKISQEFYDDAYKWPFIYRVNKDRIADHDTIKIGWELRIPDIEFLEKYHPKGINLVAGNNYAPFTDETLQEGGMITEIVRMTFEAMGYKPKIEYWNWAYGYKAAKDGIFSATFPYLKNVERNQDFYYSQPLFELLIFPFINKDNAFTYEGLESFQGKTLCRPEGYYTHDIQELIVDESITLIQPKELESCFKKLATGEVDVVPINEFSGQEMVHKLNLQDKVQMLANEVITIETLHVIFSRYTADGRALWYKFNKSISNLKQSGEFQEIVRKHLKNYQEILRQ